MLKKNPLSDQKEVQSQQQQNTSLIKEHSEETNPNEQSNIRQIRELAEEKNKLIDALKAAQSRVSDAEKEIASLQLEFNKMKSQINDKDQTTTDQLKLQLQQQKFLTQSQIQGQRKMVILWQSLLGVVLILVAFLLYK